MLPTAKSTSFSADLVSITSVDAVLQNVAELVQVRTRVINSVTSHVLTELSGHIK
jgi:hypothetical protein